MEERQKKIIGIVIIIIFILLFLILIWFLFFRGGEELPPPSAPGAGSKPPPAETLSKFIEVTENYDSGELKSRYWVYRERPEVKHGSYREFYKSGEKKYACEYLENELQGKVEFWYENGQMAMQGNFRDGKRDGKFLEWHPNGKAKHEYTCRDGQIEGEYKEFFVNSGTPVFEKTYIAGQAVKTLIRSADGEVKMSTEKEIANEVGGNLEGEEDLPDTDAD